MKNIVLIALLAFSPLAAILPPLAESLRELKAILQDGRLYSLAGSAEMIDSITRTESGFLVTTTHKEIEVTVNYLPNLNIGPKPFELDFSVVE